MMRTGSPTLYVIACGDPENAEEMAQRLGAAPILRPAPNVILAARGTRVSRGELQAAADVPRAHNDWHFVSALVGDLISFDGDEQFLQSLALVGRGPYSDS